ncbi:hypothetical protein [Enterococcus ureilyticus]|uniref:hypothetical protein n=1 Tax=Enterococcus ureilyticus TaxID=1131292 RepID=UPI001EF97D8B|nr:hypothetical protein [Enterococcus ureilyticus]MBM7687334.1 hypothetical protein [Enterococcus ureilyticus]
MPMERPDERKALEILLAAEPQKYKEAILLDKPDSQNPTRNIGVEVTQSLKESVLQVLHLKKSMFMTMSKFSVSSRKNTAMMFYESIYLYRKIRRNECLFLLPTGIPYLI